MDQKEITSTLKPLILKQYKPELNQMKNFISSNTSHLLILYNDNLIFSYILKYIKKEFKNKNLKTLNLDKDLSLLSRKLYTILNNENDNITILYSKQPNCIDRQERRIKSRFNQNIVFLKPIDYKFVTSLFKQDKKFIKSYKNELKIFQDKNKNLNDILNFYIQKLYDIENYKMVNTMEMLKPIHFAIILAVKKYKFCKILSINENVKKIKIGIPQLKNFDCFQVNRALNDLIEFEIVKVKHSKLFLYFPFFEIYEYVDKKSPIYLKQMFIEHK